MKKHLAMCKIASQGVFLVYRKKCITTFLKKVIRNYYIGFNCENGKICYTKYNKTSSTHETRKGRMFE